MAVPDHKETVEGQVVTFTFYSSGHTLRSSLSLMQTHAPAMVLSQLPKSGVWEEGGTKNISFQVFQFRRNYTGPDGKTNVYDASVLVSGGPHQNTMRWPKRSPSWILDAETRMAANPCSFQDLSRGLLPCLFLTSGGLPGIQNFPRLAAAKHFNLLLFAQKFSSPLSFCYKDTSHMGLESPPPLQPVTPSP